MGTRGAKKVDELWLVIFWGLSASNLAIALALAALAK